MNVMKDRPELSRALVLLSAQADRVSGALRLPETYASGAYLGGSGVGQGSGELPARHVRFPYERSFALVPLLVLLNAKSV